MPTSFRSHYSYWLTRALLLRGIGLIYAVAFLILVRQGSALIGQQGILPADRFLEHVAAELGSRGAGFWELPSLFWLSATDSWLRLGAWLGLALGLAALAGLANAPVMLALWMLYLSFTHVGQIFYGYGWDSLLCESGFLAAFLAPAWKPGERNATSPPSLIVIVLFRWLVFRIMFGAGLIKLRGDPCWTDLSCLFYHYETQPNPGPLSQYFHAAPRWFHELGTAFNHFVEVLVPFGVFGPRWLRALAGSFIVVFQSILIASGNLSFLNWLTLILAFSCFDDQQLLRLTRGSLRSSLQRALTSLGGAQPSARRRAVSIALAVVVGVLSLDPIANLLSPRQAMNASFDPFGLVNTYGAFGSVSRERYELVIEGSPSASLSEHSEWREYELPCKPGPVERAPCLVTPYHYRLDWQLWFVPLAPEHQRRWFLSLTNKLLQNDVQVTALLSSNPFPERPPRFIRARFFHYELLAPDEGAVWRRTPAGQYLAPTSLADPELREALGRYGLGD
jgi:hypothetical protein